MFPAGQPRRILACFLLLWAGLSAFYLYGLSSTGLLGPDEPRYASIARLMARSGDWLTPRLWGSPWFEKPPLTYWLIALGHLAGLGDDLAPRLPIAVCSLLFLAVQWLVLRRLYGEAVAWTATLILATSAGWAAYSMLGVTDLPLAASFNAALLSIALWFESASRRAAYAAAVCLALAVLAKGFVPLVLILPALWLARGRWRQWLGPAAVFLLLAAPWLLAMSLVHGRAFFDEFVLRHHLARFYAPDLLHVQPIWFFFPVLVGGLFPWSPTLAVLGPWCWRDAALRLPAATFAFGFLFFSLSTNKLPGYLLPLLPPLVILLSAGLTRARLAWRPLAWTVLLAGLCPVIVAILPESLLYGLRRAAPGGVRWELFALLLPLAAAVWWLDRGHHRPAAVSLAAAVALAGLAFIKFSSAPMLDQFVSARGLWRRVQPVADSVCIERLHRNWRYGLNYYSDTPLPDCRLTARPLAVGQPPGGLPRLYPRRDPRATGAF